MQTLRPDVGTVFCTDHIHSVTTDRVKTALELSGLNPALLRDLAKRFCFARAKTRLTTDGIIDEVLENDARWVFQLSDKFLDRADQSLSYEKRAQFWYDKETQTVGADNEEVLSQVNTLFAKYGATYLPSDVSTLIKRVFKSVDGMISLRRHGVVYFVPAEASSVMEKVALFLTQIGAECLTIPIAAGNKQVIDKTLSMLVGDIQADLLKITEEMKTLQLSGETMTSRIAKNRWKTLLSELDRIKLFAKSLSVDAGDLLRKTRTQEIDLAFVTADSMDIVAALAHNGKMPGALGQLAKAAFEGELPAILSPRVQRFAAGLAPEVGEVELPSLKNIKLNIGATVEL